MIVVLSLLMPKAISNRQSEHVLVPRQDCLQQYTLFQFDQTVIAQKIRCLIITSDRHCLCFARHLLDLFQPSRTRRLDGARYGLEKYMVQHLHTAILKYSFVGCQH